MRSKQCTVRNESLTIKGSHTPIKNCFFAAILWDSWTQRLLALSWVFWEPIPGMGALKVGTLDVWSKHFALQGEAGSRELPPSCIVLRRG